jgi:ABC-type glycerol-3-phosphate transport system permease component
MPVYKSERLFHIVNAILFIVVGCTMMAPMIHVLAISLSSYDYVNINKVYLWPRGFTLSAYKLIFGEAHMWRAMGVTVYITVMGTLFHLFFTSTMAYALSRPMMVGRKLILKGLIVTFIFSAPLIPRFLVVHYLGMVNTFWALIVPGAVGAFAVIIMKTFFQGISSEIFDAGHIDGCSEYGIFFRLTIPLSMPVFATMGLFHAVGEWNSYFDALIFIRDKTMFPLQIVLRSLVQGSEMTSQFDKVESDQFSLETLKSGVIIFATVPILLIYPFLQKYFVKGAMVGSLKE